ncbi:hypothetical protein EYF80_061418 [Liparis tanakae]|uniref:Uncharacterized protein n=1 Tax=Liparis tanakae TaxID=230148 RepID=A0A4Z2EJ22_9TELE|nr:hypothetical protein EYF80_061418 [Liparis tanakae]
MPGSVDCDAWTRKPFRPGASKTDAIFQRMFRRAVLVVAPAPLSAPGVGGVRGEEEGRDISSVYADTIPSRNGKHCLSQEEDRGAAPGHDGEQWDTCSPRCVYDEHFRRSV